MPARRLLRLRNCCDRSAVEGIVSSALVDIAEIERVDPLGVYLTPFPGVDVNSDGEQQWFQDVVQQALAEFGQHDVVSEWLPADPTQA